MPEDVATTSRLSLTATESASPRCGCTGDGDPLGLDVDQIDVEILLWNAREPEPARVDGPN